MERDSFRWVPAAAGDGVIIAQIPAPHKWQNRAGMVVCAEKKNKKFVKKSKKARQNAFFDV
jgi:hypothetical protein